MFFKALFFFSLYICHRNHRTLRPSLTFITHKIVFPSTRRVIPPGRLRDLPAPFYAIAFTGFTVLPTGEVRRAPAIGPHPPTSPSSQKPDPAKRRAAAQRLVQRILVVHVVHGGQVGVLYPAEALSLVPSQGVSDEVEPM